MSKIASEDQRISLEIEVNAKDNEAFFKEIDDTKQKWREECPEFEDFEYNKILDWLAIDNKGEIVWEDIFISFKDGVETRHVSEKFAHWSFAWKFGVMGFLSFKKEEEEKAKKTAAMFAWLWLKKGIPAQYAKDFAESYCRKTIYRM